VKRPIRWLAGLFRRRPNRLEWALGLFSAAVVVLAALTLSPGATRFTKSALGNRSLLGKVNQHLNPFRSRHALMECSLPVYDLKIKPAQYRGILAIVEQAKQRGYLAEDLKQWSKATFIHGGKTRQVKIRVRGSLSNHWAGERKHWRIRFPKDDPLDGRSEVNLLTFNDGKGVTQRFVNALFARLGLMTLRDEYVVLRINGSPQGVYYCVEHFDAAFLAHHHRPESTIFSHPRRGWEPGSFMERITHGDEAAWRALQLLLNYETDPTPDNLTAALCVTDVEDFLRYIAGTTLLGSDHSAMLTDNHRLHYDSSRGLFYRIPWDLEPQPVPRLLRFDMEDTFATFDVFAVWPMSRLRIAMLRDKSYRLRRDRILWELVRDDSLLVLFDEAYRGLDIALWSDVMGRGDEEARLARFRNLVRFNIERIREILVGSGAQRRGLNELAIGLECPELATLQFAANSASGIRVRKVQLSGEIPGTACTLYRDLDENGRVDPRDRIVARGQADLDGVVTLGELDELLLPETGLAEDYPAYLYQSGADGAGYKVKSMRTVVYTKTARATYLLTRGVEEEVGTSCLKGPKGAAHKRNPWPTITAEVVNAVTDRPLANGELAVRSCLMTSEFAPTRRLASRARFLEANPQFVPDSQRDDLVVLPGGRQRIPRTVVVPQGVTLKIQPGAVLEMGPEVSLVCFGPIIADGTAETPIQIVPAADSPWGTVAAVRSGGGSVFRHVHLAGGQGATVDGILFTGALAVHDGDAIVEHCRITDCPAEDALNIKNATATIRETLFRDNHSDAIDLDFVDGEVTRCHFIRNAGDGIDISGSRITIAGNQIERAGDKGISIGEQSRVTLENNLLVDNVIGVAVKDLSEARIDNCTFIRNATSVAAYRKKPIFGGCRAQVRASILLETEKPVTTDPFSTVEVSGCLLPGHYRASGCAVAAADLADRLERSGFVFNADNASANDGEARAQAGQDPLGILGPPVDLR